METIERRIGDLTVRIDRLLCVGFADCVEAAPESFALDYEGIAAFTGDPGAAGSGRLIEACQACPVDALTVLDANGRQIAPA